MNNQDKILGELYRLGQEKHESERVTSEFTGDKEADIFINDIETYPHAFVIACLMDRQIRSESAWKIPYILYNDLGTFEFESLLRKGENYFIDIFEQKKLHRFIKKMPKNIYKTLNIIDQQYNGDASNIWNETPRGGVIVQRFEALPGIGIKIATMATNLLYRNFKINIQDMSGVDISPDVHVSRVFERMGLIPKRKSKEMRIAELIHVTRTTNPKYPGIYDYGAWIIGRDYCHSSHPKCKKCVLKHLCPRKL